MKSVDIQPTVSQSELISKFQAFLKGEDRIFRLTGKPGVGKTTITKIILKELIDKDLKNESTMNVAGITMAHQAKNVLGEFIPNVFTFASAYGLKEVIDNHTGKRSFEYNQYHEGPLVGKMNIPVFVHDEVSMYTPEMLEIVLENTSIFSKIIFIGDPAQLPPIIEEDGILERDKDSPVFSLSLSENCQHELTERVRQAAGNPILKLSDVIREQIFGDHLIKPVLEPMREASIADGVGYQPLRYQDLLDHIKDKDILNTRILAFRNSAINWFNPKVRNHLLGNPTKLLVPGDVIIMRDTFFNEDNGHKYRLYNSESFRIGKVDTSVLKNYAGGKQYYIHTYVAKIEGRDKDLFIIPTEAGEEQLEVALDYIATQCRARQMKWEEYWNFRKKFCEYNYGYSSTTYKAQGSSYDCVYVDINDILLTKPISDKVKLQTIYTAITRARENVYLLKS